MKRCDCPVPTVAASLPTIDPCPTDTGQIQRLIFVDRGTEYPIASLTSETFWSDKQISTAANDKAIFTPLIGNPEFEPGDALEFGGGNETINGIPLIVGNDPTTFNFRFYSPQKGMIKALKVLTCRQIDVFMLNENNQCAYNEKTTTTATGFPVQSFNIMDLRPGGYSEPDYHAARLSLEEDWSDDYALTAQFDWDPMAV
jgi:hypothetical protein